MRCTAAVFAVVLLVTACQSAPARPAVAGSAAAAEAIHARLRATWGENLLLAEDAFRTSSRLTLEVGRRVGAIGAPATASGRVLNEPLRLQLMLDGPNCYVQELASGRRHPVARGACIPEEASQHP